MATCICGDWIHNQTFTKDAKYDALCDNCKIDAGYSAPLSKEELKLLRDRKKRLSELAEKYDDYIEDCLDTDR